ncbi:MAG: polymer-forming cytoskeletal protein [Candidatus Acidiferrales bacterium]
MSHFDEMTGLLYLEGQLDSDHAEAIRGHAAGCAECRGLLRALQSESVWLRESLEADDETVPARLVQVPQRGGAPWGWISALGLSAGGAYTLWSGFVEPWRAQAAQAGFTQGNLLTMLFFSGAFWKGWDAMRSLMEFVAVATLGLVVMWLVRRHVRHTTALAVVMGAIVFALVSGLALAPVAGAAETMHGHPNYTLAAGEVVHTDLFVFADTTVIDGDVDGDLIAWSRNVVVNGHVKGDVIAFSQELRVNGPVDGNVRAMVQELQLESSVGRNAMAWAGDVDMDPQAKVNGTMTLFAGHASLNGNLTGDLLALVGDLEIDGTLGRNAMIRSGHLMIGAKADIAGDTKAELRQPPDIAATAKFGTPLSWTITKKSYESSYSSLRYYLHQILKWGASFVFGLALLFLLPGFFFDASSACQKVGPAIGFGILLLFATPIAAVILCITIVGLGLGISAVMLWAIAMYAAQVFVGAWLGEKVLGTGAGAGAALGRLALGLVILRALGMLPFLGGWISFVVVVWGMGAVALAVYKNMRPHLAAATV